MSFKMVINGGKSLPPEWFDLDRGEKMDEKPRENNIDYYENIEVISDAEFHLVKCPHCGSDDSRIVSTVFGADGEAWSMNCQSCGKRFEALKKFG